MLTKFTLGKVAAAALALTITAAPAFSHDPGSSGPDQGQRGPGPGMTTPHMMGPGTMPYHQGDVGHDGMHQGPGRTGHGAMHHGPGMSFGQGWTGHGGMHQGPGWMGQGGMGHGGMHQGPGWMGQGGMGGYGSGPGALRQDLAADDVKHILQHRLQWQGFTNLRVGDIAEKDDDTLTADVVTEEGTLVQQFEVNRHTGAIGPAQ